MTSIKRLAEYFRKNVEENARIRRLLHEADDGYQFKDTDKFQYKPLDADPKSRFEQKVIDVFPKHEVDGAIKKWQSMDKNLEGDKKIIDAAKKGDKSASVYIWVTKVRDVVAQNFWKFLGPDPVIRKRRIDNNEMYDYLSLAWGAMTFGNKDLIGDAGMLERFKPEMYDHGTLWKQFRNMFRLLLMNFTTAWNNKEKLGGVTGVKGSIARGTLGQDEGIHHQSYDAAFDDVDAQGGRNEVGFANDVESEYIKKENFATWKKFASDSDMTDPGKDVSAAQVFAVVVGDPGATVTGMAQKFGVKPDAIKAKMQQALDIMKEYGLEQEDLRGLISSVGNAGLAKHLDPKFKADPKSEKTDDRKKSGEGETADERKKRYAQEYYARLKAKGKIPQKAKKD